MFDLFHLNLHMLSSGRPAACLRFPVFFSSPSFCHGTRSIETRQGKRRRRRSSGPLRDRHRHEGAEHGYSSSVFDGKIASSHAESNPKENWISGYMWVFERASQQFQIISMPGSHDMVLDLKQGTSSPAPKAGPKKQDECCKIL